jgi:hypothetical protein
MTRSQLPYRCREWDAAHVCLIDISLQGITTRFVTGFGLANELLEACQGLTRSRIINRYARPGLLLVDLC